VTAAELISCLAVLPRDTEIRIGDVSEGDDLHCSVGGVVLRSERVVLVPGDDDVWKDETISSTIHMKRLWPEDIG